jgi:hypothetical protein
MGCEAMGWEAMRWEAMRWEAVWVGSSVSATTLPQHEPINQVESNQIKSSRVESGDQQQEEPDHCAERSPVRSSRVKSGHQQHEDTDHCAEALLQRVGAAEALGALEELEADGMVPAGCRMGLVWYGIGIGIGMVWYGIGMGLRPTEAHDSSARATPAGSTCSSARGGIKGGVNRGEEGDVHTFSRCAYFGGQSSWWEERKRAHFEQPRESMRGEVLRRVDLPRGTHEMRSGMEMR